MNPGTLAGFNVVVQFSLNHSPPKTPARWPVTYPDVLPRASSSIKLQEAGNALCHGDTQPGAGCGGGDGMVLEYGIDEVGTFPSWNWAAISFERTATHAISSQEMLSKVFRDAKRMFEEDIRYAGRMGQSPFEGKTSMLDVQLELLNVLKHYESTSESKARKWLVALSERITFYGQMFDVLVQHHPEYVSLAWGTFKFIFQVILLSSHGCH